MELTMMGIRGVLAKQIKEQQTRKFHGCIESLTMVQHLLIGYVNIKIKRSIYLN